MGKSQGQLHLQHRELALEFAEAVTVPADWQGSKLARAGQHSLFEVFTRCCPWAVRCPEGKSQNGLSIQEFNKLLEDHGFIKVRRSPPALGEENFADPNNPRYTGAYAFARLRWRDPTDDEDFEALAEARRSMEVLFCHDNNRIVEEHTFMAYILEAKLEGERLMVTRRTSHPSRTSSANAYFSERSASPEVDPRKRSRDEYHYDDCESKFGIKRTRTENTLQAQKMQEESNHIVRTSWPWWNYSHLAQAGMVS